MTHFQIHHLNIDSNPQAFLALHISTPDEMIEMAEDMLACGGYTKDAILVHAASVMEAFALTQDEHHVRSTSVGDVIQYRDRAWLVAPVGYLEITIPVIH